MWMYEFLFTVLGIYLKAWPKGNKMKGKLAFAFAVWRRDWYLRYVEHQTLLDSSRLITEVIS